MAVITRAEGTVQPSKGGGEERARSLGLPAIVWRWTAAARGRRKREGVGLVGRLAYWPTKGKGKSKSILELISRFRKNG
jgi:hypothetical protein